MFRTTERRPTSKDEEVVGCGDDCQPFMGGNEMDVIQEVQIDMFGKKSLWDKLDDEGEDEQMI